MTGKRDETSPARLSSLTSVGMTAAVVMFLLGYGVELASFSLSIDEEVATFLGDSWRAWLSQGRWGMALVTWGLPGFESIPFLSTAIFGAGLVFATHCALRDLRLGPAQGVVFAILHVGFPVWLHIAQFNTLAAGFGLGLAAAAFGAGLVLRARTWGERSLAVACIAFAVAVYQTLAIYAACYLLFVLHATLRGPLMAGVPILWRDVAGRISLAVASMVAAVLAYALVQRVGLGLAGLEIEYVDGFVQLEGLRTDTGAVARQGLASLLEHLSGQHAIYIGWGAWVWALAWLGLFPWAALRGGDRAVAVRVWSLTLSTALLATVVLFVPFLLSAGYLPTRAHVALPLLAAWLASQLLPPGLVRIPRPLWVGLGYLGLVLASIAQSMFYADRVARDIDASLTAQLLPAIVAALGEDAGKPFDITLSGSRALPPDSPIERAEVFGNSFYEHDGGNPARVALYLRFHGVDNVGSVRLATRPDLVAAASEMPEWPVNGSVKLVNGVVIIKFGEPTYQQTIGD